MSPLACAVLIASVAMSHQALATKGCQKTFSCMDCHTLQICIPNPTFSNKRNNTIFLDCSRTSLPYCDDTKGSCSATPSTSCAPRDFTCLSDGYFPDPYDNTVFHLCVDLSPTRYKCESYQPYYVYSVILHRCVENASTGYDCDGKDVVKTPHPADHNLFAVCVNGTATLQDRCPGSYEMNESSQACVPVCKMSGLQPDLSNCTMFFRCVQQNGGYFKSHEQCPLRQAFNPVTLSCGDDHSYCNLRPTPKKINPLPPNTTKKLLSNTIY